MPFSEEGEEGGHLLSHFRLFLQSNRIVFFIGLVALQLKGHSACVAVKRPRPSTLDVHPESLMQIQGTPVVAILQEILHRSPGIVLGPMK